MFLIYLTCCAILGWLVGGTNGAWLGMSIYIAIKIILGTYDLWMIGSGRKY